MEGGDGARAAGVRAHEACCFGLSTTPAAAPKGQRTQQTAHRGARNGSPRGGGGGGRRQRQRDRYTVVYSGKGWCAVRGRMGIVPARSSPVPWAIPRRCMTRILSLLQHQAKAGWMRTPRARHEGRRRVDGSFVARWDRWFRIGVRRSDTVGRWDTARQLGRGGRRRCGWRIGMPVRAGRSCRPAAWVTLERDGYKPATGLARDSGQVTTPTQQQQHDFKQDVCGAPRSAAK